MEILSYNRTYQAPNKPKYIQGAYSNGIYISRKMANKS